MQKLKEKNLESIRTQIDSTARVEILSKKLISLFSFDEETSKMPFRTCRMQIERDITLSNLNTLQSLKNDKQKCQQNVKMYNPHIFSRFLF